MSHQHPNFRLLPLIFALGATLSVSAQAQSLVDLYTAALGYDTTYQAAKSQFDATVAKADQSRAAILPTAALSAGASNTNQEVVPAAARTISWVPPPSPTRAKRKPGSTW